MKTGYYIRYVPVLSCFCFYFWDGKELAFLSEIGWHETGFKKPSRRNGFSYVCNEVFE